MVRGNKPEVTRDSNSTIFPEAVCISDQIARCSLQSGLYCK